MDETTDINESSLSFRAFPVTVCFILLLQLTFLYQFMQRRRGREVKSLTSYKELVRRRRFYRVWIACISHPARRRADHEEDYAVSNWPWFQSREYEQVSAVAGRSDAVMFRIRQWLNYSGRFRGLLLLFYNCHIIWTCRALERYYDNYSLQFPLILINLAFITILLEIYVSFGILRQSQLALQLVDVLSSSERAILRQACHYLKNRSIGTVTLLTSALLTVYRHVLPEETLQIFPFIPNPSLLPNPLAYILCIFNLIWLSNQVHSTLSIVSGCVTGFVWGRHLLDFFEEAYWGYGLFGYAAMSTMLSLPARTISLWIPCIDYVHLPVFEEPTRQDDDTVASEEDESDQEEREAFPSLDDVEIYGRLPEWRDDEEAEAELLPTRTFVRARRNGLLS